ncbi:MAG: WbuC family cupin fold metalloprotein [Prevotellaceae bacterium]|jgi:cupin fold WbuC family metalloprotein|nr:WbuC family cupin fold metalloprotein [Prevotellaceae bacterium]
MKIIDKELLDEVSAKAVKNSRLRMNYNFHKTLDDPLNRLLNAMEPNSYFPPHRHLNPDKNESFIVLRGSIMIFIFNNEGEVVLSKEISPDKGVFGMEIEAGVWHSLVVLKSGTVVYEIKPGPYVPVSPENTAPWAPSPDNKQEAEKYMDKLMEIAKK